MVGIFLLYSPLLFLFPRFEKLFASPVIWPSIFLEESLRGPGYLIITRSIAVIEENDRDAV
jgi:hypothetical protein